jgi:hypothetical protein
MNQTYKRTTGLINDESGKIWENDVIVYFIPYHNFLLYDQRRLLNILRLAGMRPGFEPDTFRE